MGKGGGPGSGRDGGARSLRGARGGEGGARPRQMFLFALKKMIDPAFSNLAAPFPLAPGDPAGLGLVVPPRWEL